MPYVFTKVIDEQKHAVERIVYVDELLSEGEKANAYYFTEIPEPESIEGKVPRMFLNPTTREIFYEYVDRPLTPEEELRQRIELMQQALDDLLLGGM